MGLSRKPVGTKEKKPNPFDTKVTKVKFDVLNRDKRGIKGTPALAKQRSTEIRRSTLLPELKGRGKTSSFVDRRFGERDKNLTQEEKMLERFSRERQSAAKKSSATGPLKLKKKSIFNLDASEEYGDDSLAGLTHLGQDVEDISEFSDPEEGNFAHEKGMIESREVRHGHFGGYDDEEEEDGMEEGCGSDLPKTKAEVMKEVMAKSKFYKAERQKVKEENIELCDALDQDFASLRPSLLSNKYDRSKEVRVEDDYDAALKAMLFDKRSKPSDRTLTAEEAQKKREEQVEAREARMAGRRPDADDSEDEDNDAAKDGKKKEVSETRVIDKEEERASVLLDEFCAATNREQLAAPYARLVELSQGPSSVSLGRAIRSHLALILSRLKHDRHPFFPGKASLMLFHLIGRIYSTSDFHHVIASPAQLLMTCLLEHGRMTRPKHVVSAIFIAQTMLHYQRDSKRIVPEVFNVVSLLLAYVYGTKPDQHSFDGIHNRLVADRLASALHGTKGVEPCKLSFEDLDVESKEFTPELAMRIKAALLMLVKNMSSMYADLPAFVEYITPLVALVKDESSFLPILSLILDSSKSRRKPLLLQHHKPVALPMLNPEYGQKEDRDTRDGARLKAAYKREFKGAKREIRRDNEFLARHEAQERTQKDADYKKMINRVYGTISNDAAGMTDNKKRRTK